MNVYFCFYSYQNVEKNVFQVHYSSSHQIHKPFIDFNALFLQFFSDFHSLLLLMSKCIPLNVLWNSLTTLQSVHNGIMAWSDTSYQLCAKALLQNMQNIWIVISFFKKSNCHIIFVVSALNGIFWSEGLQNPSSYLCWIFNDYPKQTTPNPKTLTKGKNKRKLQEHLEELPWVNGDNNKP